MRRTTPSNRKTTRPPLSRERVLAAAVNIADRDGLTAVTMRRLAAALRVEAMSLYHHLPGKEALLDGLVDNLAAEIDREIASLPLAAGWREVIRQRCLAARAVMLRHPWAPGLIASRTAIPPSLYLHFEASLATMIDGGFSYHLAHRAMHALGSMMLGFVQELFSQVGAGDAPGERAVAQLAEMAAKLPHVTAMVAAEIHAHDGDTLGWCDSQAEFEFTLDLILDGLDRRMREVS
jgi:AcrR family transcriptional regulator